jgi:hypothetical protein
VVARQWNTVETLPALRQTASQMFEGVEPLTAEQEADAIVRGWVVDNQ